MDKDPKVKLLVERSEDTQDIAGNADEKVNVTMRKLQDSSVRSDKVFYITKGGIPVCVVGEEISKPDVKEVIGEKLECNHDVVFQTFVPITNATYIETPEQLILIDKTITQAAIEVFDHTYRSYKGFTCFISLGDTNGNIYIIDAIKFRDLIPSLNFLKCGVSKIMHCRGCATRLIVDFKQLGCFRNCKVPPKRVFVDWRIRPVPSLLLEVLQEGVLKTVDQIDECVDSRDLCLDEDEESADLKSIISKFDILRDEDILGNLLKLRRYIAKSNNESVHYVMTDEQLVRIFHIRPNTQDEFSDALSRLSPLARQHLTDFLLALNGTRKGFSLQGLMKPRNGSTQDVPISSNQGPECEIDIDMRNVRLGNGRR